MILECDCIVKKFGGLVAVNRVSVSVREGEIFGLIGPNGAGKTTLINVVAGAYKPDGGSVRFMERDITGWPAHRISRCGISRTFQIVRCFPRMTALENVMVPLIFSRPAKNRKAAETSARELLDYVGFSLPVNILAKHLNTIQRKRLDLARALAGGCKLLLLDELAAGLTPTELIDLMSLIRKIRDTGITIVTIEHVMRVIMEICDRIAVLHYGEKIAEGSPEEIVSNQRVIEAYLGEKYIL